MEFDRGKYQLPDELDSTMLHSFRSCNVEFARAYVVRLRPKGESIHLIAGGAFAKGLEIARRSFYEEGFNAEDSLVRGLAALTHTYGDPTVLDERKSWLNTAMALAYYLDVAYPFERDIIQPAVFGGKRAIEFTFAIPIEIVNPCTGNPFTLVGRTDMIGAFQGLNFIVDEKTTGMLGPTWKDKWGLRAQLMQYTWAARTAGFNVVGAFIRGVGLKKEIEIQEAGLFYFEERWYEQTLQTIQAIVRCYETGWWNFDFGDTCTRYGGCPFRELCLKRTPEQWYGGYEFNDWSPLSVEKFDVERLVKISPAIDRR
jgi:hypothetical protein